jgi:RNase P/RNase MRP subunit p29
MTNFSKKKIIEDILYGFLIGKRIKILNSPNKNYIGKEGELVKETKNTFILKIGNEYKKFLKKGLIIELEYNKDLKLEIDIDKTLKNLTIIERIKKIKI